MGKARTRSAQSGVTLDAGALIALDNGDRKMIALILEAISQHRTFRIPAGVVGQTWRDGRRQANLARFLRATEVEVVPLDEALGRACGELCGITGTNDVVDASVVIIARERQDLILTSDPDDLRRLDQEANLVRI